MLTENEARALFLKEFPGANIDAIIDDGNRFIARIFINQVGEEAYDPYFSIDKITRQIMDFSLPINGTKQILDKFMNLRR